MLVGVIDIGSNTVRLTVYDVDEENRSYSTFFKMKTMAGLVSYIDRKTQLMSDKGVAVLTGTLDEYLTCTRKFRDIQGPHAFATASLRNARNCAKVIRQVEKSCGLQVDLISGNEEARLGYIGAMRSSTLTGGMQIDVGGGSTEVTTFEQGELLHSVSIPAGSLSLFTSYVHGMLPSPAEMGRIRQHFHTELEQVEEFKGFSCSTASGVGGSVRVGRRIRNAWMHDVDPASNLSYEQIGKILDWVGYDPYEATRFLLQTAPERIHTAVPGLVDVHALMEHFGVQEIEVHDSGVREGYLLSHVLGWSA